jgi:flagellar motor switch protein FliN/FliY
MSQTSSSPNSSSSSELAPEALVPLHDVICAIDVILGSATMSVRQCLQLRPETIVRLAESAGGDMQVVVNGIAIARGEVVIVDDSTAVRITDILPPPSSEIVE